jgi:surfeit locus 1 family protein
MSLPLKALPFYNTAPRFLPALIAMLMFCVLLALGFWQVQRAQWKEGVISTRAQKLALPPLSMQDMPSFGADDLMYRSFTIKSAARFDVPFALFTSLPRQGAGYQLYIPVDIGFNRRFLLKGDFISMQDEKHIAPIAPRQAPLNVFGVFAPAPALDMLMPFKADKARSPVDARAYAPLQFIPADSNGGPEYDSVKTQLMDIPNNHAAYAFTWFSLAFALVLIYLRSELIARNQE